MPRQPTTHSFDLSAFTSRTEQRRKQLGLPMASVSSAAGLKPGAYRDMIARRKSPSLAAAIGYAKALGCSLESLVGTTRTDANGILTVPEAISTHLAAVEADEASFTVDGKPHDVLAAERTGWVECEAFVAFARTPCATAEDVQAKMRHLLDGTVGERDSHLCCLADYGDTLLEEFLRSLLIEEKA